MRSNTSDSTKSTNPTKAKVFVSSATGQLVAACKHLRAAYAAAGDSDSIDWNDVDHAHELAGNALRAHRQSLRTQIANAAHVPAALDFAKEVAAFVDETQKILSGETPARGKLDVFKEALSELGAKATEVTDLLASGRNTSFTVVGFYPESKQRFTESFEANSPGEAEKAAMDMYPALVVVATFDGSLDPVDEVSVIRED